LVQARRHGFHPDIAGTGDTDIGFLAGRDLDIAAAGDMDIGALNAGVAEKGITAAGYRQIHLVDPSACVWPFPAADG